MAFIHTHAQTGSNSEVMSSSIQVDCAVINESVKTLGNCYSFSWGMAYPSNIPGNCTAERYTGSVCRPQLLEWQECTAGGADDVFIDLAIMEQSQEESERDVAQFLHFLSELIVSSR